MRGLRNFVGAFFLAAVMIVPVAITGCGSTTDVYDAGHGDHHNWDDHEETVYKGWLSDNHKDYKPIKQASPEDQKSYWDWRHNNPGK